MEKPVEPKDPTPPDGQAGEAPNGADAGELDAKPGATDDGWSINDVPPEMRPHVEKAIKPFHSRTTKAEQRAAEVERRLKEIEPQVGNSEALQRQIEAIRDNAARLVTDDEYRESIRKRFGLHGTGGNKNDPLPEGWNDPEAVKARNLLFNEVVKGIEDKYGVRISELSKVANAAKGIDNFFIQNAQEEINQTQKQITEEGLPWNDEIVDACIAVVGKNTKMGKQMSLRQAYDSIIKPVIDAQNKKIASTDKNLRDKHLPLKPDGKGGQTRLSGDALLRNVINDLNIPGSFND